MAEGGTHLGETGHSEDEVTISRRVSWNGPSAEITGYPTQPASTGVQRIESDGYLSLSPDFLRSHSTYNGPANTRRDNDISRPVSHPPSWSSVDYAQSVSGFSDTRMNVPPDGHLQQLSSENSLEVDSAPIQSLQQIQDLSLLQPVIEDTSRHIRLLDDMLALERDQNKVVKYRKTAQLLQDSNISEYSIIDVVIQNGIPCLESRSRFFELYDKEEVSDESSTPTRRPNAPVSAVSSEINVDVPRHPAYADGTARLDSYKTWPGAFYSRKEMCDAGLFYTGDGDKCRCYHCGLSLLKWENGDIPIVEHYGHNKTCKVAEEAYILYLQRQNRVPQNVLSTSLQSQRPDTVQDNSGYRICQVCKTREIGISQFKCGHIVCVRCVPPKPPNEGKRFCKIEGCGREVVRAVPYDSTALMNSGQ